MNIPKRGTIPTILCMALGGCGNAAPHCDDPAIRELVADMIERHYEKLADAPLELPTAPLPGAVIAEMDNVRTVSFNAETRVRQCVGSVSLTGPAASPADVNNKMEMAYQIGPSEKDQGYSVTLQWP
jgi:hypothetical protein